MAGCLITCAWAVQTYLVSRHEIKELVHFDYVHGDIKWDPRSTSLYPLFFCSAGLFPGMFGIGGRNAGYCPIDAHDGCPSKKIA